MMRGGNRPVNPVLLRGGRGLIILLFILSCVVGGCEALQRLFPGLLSNSRKMRERVRARLSRCGEGFVLWLPR